MKWQPIETATREERVQGYLPKLRCKLVTDIYYKTKKELMGDPWPEEGWYFNTMFGAKLCEPTHWMPLPKAPRK